ncbi:MAG: hypothetical protein KF819_25255 [Labilithrix sp.]|nr:hypothetical protein [Labilithrix sp.]
MRALPVFVSFSFVLVAACGGGSLPTPGEHKLIDKTFAGQNKCNPKNADRPFIVEWDATDQSSFQALAASDVIFVRYQGCELKALDGCRDDSVKGSLGSYKPVEFTSGGVESIDIHDEGELYAKLPLGAASLSGRVQSGEKFHMEYYVSGTRTATRDKVYKGDLAKNPRCAEATHFVYAYNLGAFALASQSSLKAQVDGSYFGFKAGGKTGSTTNAEKRGGELSACKGESAKEVESCKVPIRLTLREIEGGSDPAASAASAPETDASLNLAGQLKATTDAEKKALGHLESANVKKQSRDGKGCLDELTQHDALDPRPAGLSTNPASGKNAGLRAECMMLAGQCEAGKAHFRKALAATKSGDMGPEHMDRVTDATAAQSCAGGNLSERDQYLRAMSDLTKGGLGVQSKTVAECQAAFDTFMKLRTTVKRKDASDSQVPEKPLTAMGATAPLCFAKAGDCGAALKAFKAINDAKGPDDAPKAKDDKMLRTQFDALVPICKGK